MLLRKLIVHSLNTAHVLFYGDTGLNGQFRRRRGDLSTKQVVSIVLVVDIGGYIVVYLNGKSEFKFWY